MTSLPLPTPPFEGEVARLLPDATPQRLRGTAAPDGAPNVLLILLDDVGVDSGSPVGPYPHQYPCEARIVGVTLERLDRPSDELRRLVDEGMFRAGLSTQ